MAVTPIDSNKLPKEQIAKLMRATPFLSSLLSIPRDQSSMALAVAQSRSETRDLLVVLIRDNLNSLDNLPLTVRLEIDALREKLLALETAWALLLASEKRAFDVAVEYATDAITKDIVVGVEEDPAAADKVMAEFEQEWYRQQGY